MIQVEYAVNSNIMFDIIDIVEKSYMDNIDLDSEIIDESLAIQIDRVREYVKTLKPIK